MTHPLKIAELAWSLCHSWATCTAFYLRMHRKFGTIWCPLPGLCAAQTPFKGWAPGKGKDCRERKDTRIFDARRSYASAVLGVVILSVCMSVRPSVTRVLCDKPNNAVRTFWYHTKRAITLVFWRQQWLVGDANPATFPSEICAQSDPTHSKSANFDRFLLITS